MVDSIYRTRSLGVAAEGLPDQYADGRAARVWQLYIGDTRSRTAEYRSWLVSLLRGQGCKTVLDVACGTGVDSIMLVEEGFQVTSVDASDKMLKYALKERWNRRKEGPFDHWVIEEANWLTLPKDMQKPGAGFDAVICLGNSFSHLPGIKGDQTVHKQALANIASMVRPGGILVIDHRNYDYILKTGRAPPGKNIYYKIFTMDSERKYGAMLLPETMLHNGICSHVKVKLPLLTNSDLTKEITTSVLLVDNKPNMVTLDYTVQVPPEENDGNPELSQFRLSYYPHLLEPFTELLKNAVQDPCEHKVLGDFKPYEPGQQYVPCYFIHVVKKTN